MPDQTDAEIEAGLLAAGKRADAGEEPQAEISATPEPSPAPAAPKDEPAPSVEDKQPPAAEGERSKTESAPTASEPEVSAYQKEQQRRQKVLAGIESRRLEVERREQEIAQREAALKQAERPAEFRDEEQYTALDYEKAARDAADKAAKARYELLDEEGAEQAKATASLLLQRAQHVRQMEFDHHRQRIGGEMVTLMPELKDENSPLRRKTDELFSSNPLFRLHPEGMRIAPMLAKAQLRAESVSALQSKIQELTKENERLNKLTGVGGTPPIRRTEGGSRELSEKDLLRMAADYDSRGVA